jgi:glutamine synthetase
MSVDELRASGIELVAGSITDLAGVTRAKYVPLRRLAAFAHAGMGVSPSWSVFCVDSGIAFTPSIGVVGDLRIRIDPADLRHVDDGVAWAPGDLHDQQGTPAPLCVRTLLARTERAAIDRGLAPLIGAELECTMLAPDGNHASTEPWSPYGMRTSLDRSAFLVDLTVAAERAGLSIEQLHTEYGHDQIEISLAPTTPVAAADAVILARIVIGRAAARHGLKISFSPVPFEGEAGNGAHLHLSLSDDAGRRARARTGSHRRHPRRSAGSAWRVRRFGVVGIAPAARQLGRRGQMLGPGEPRGGGPVHRGNAGKSPRRQRGTEDHRPQRQPVPGGHGAPW